MTRARFAIAVCLTTFALMLSGCGWWSPLTDKAASITSPKIDYRNYAPKGDKWRLAKLFSPVDQRIQVVVRELSSIETFPTPEWYERLMDRNPWLTSVAAVDAKGRLLGRLPEEAMRPLDTGQFLEFKSSWEQAEFKSFFFQTELGPEICLVQPMFVRNDWVGLIIAQFDPRSLRQFSPEPDELTVLHRDILLWPSTNANGAKALASVDWEKVLRKSVGGQMELDGRTFTWLARHIGDSFMVYAVQNRDGA